MYRTSASKVHPIEKVFAEYSIAEYSIAEYSIAEYSIAESN